MGCGEIDYRIEGKERNYLRDLARKQMEYAHLQIMEERKKRWYRHNDCKQEFPMVHFEASSVWREIYPQQICQTEIARKIEHHLFSEIINHDMIDDDRVVAPFYRMFMDTQMRLFDQKFEEKHITDSHGRDIGYKYDHLINDLGNNEVDKLSDSVFVDNSSKTLEWKEIVEDVIGDILPIRIGIFSPPVYLSYHLVQLMGLEKMAMFLYDYPDEFHKLMKRMTDDYMAYFRWLEDRSFLYVNNGNDWIGHGTFGFNTTLLKTDPVKAKNVWGYMNSQETTIISPLMYEEFFYPYYKRISEEFGLLNYGCCEPVHNIWNQCVSKYNNLRKVSVSPWCNEYFMGNALRNTNIIYHRKPNPYYIGVGRKFNEDEFRKHILKTIHAARGCRLEITFRDIYTVENDITRPARAVRIVRELLENNWK